MIHSYPWYITDWRESADVLSMTAEQRDVYRNLIDMCWRDGFLPTDERALRAMSLASEREWRRAWPIVSRQFEEHDGKLWNRKVDEKRPEVLKSKEDRKRGADKANAIRRAKRDAERSAERDAERTPPPSPSPSLTPSTEKQEENMRFDRWDLDETYEPLLNLYRESGKPVIDDDFMEAHWIWRNLDWEQKQARVEKLRYNLDNHLYSDPNFIPSPKRFIQAEYKRDLKPTLAGRAAADAQREERIALIRKGSSF